ncbi:MULTISPECIES: aspartyl-phosphate phosphatase Spo0E family protein [Metabacillus]|uniref:Aspartyl-phosphate phosphatase Spo0E family protein n=1 Tax=Metabacillus endolithicus TaxID=1535204 RepID=A0ABW5C1E1_9BACI|nr:aspartyl-phosphate phosphatase Spo0E family protein [Metabacillus endolithicus]UPG65428.1 aspartyl-phosphate phosphatase Spo0E family protein [Metabacillus endolithicus]
MIKLKIYFLKLRIYILRKQMVSTGMNKGLNHPTTLKHSQELDYLLNTYRYYKEK